MIDYFEDFKVEETLESYYDYQYYLDRDNLEIEYQEFLEEIGVSLN